VVDSFKEEASRSRHNGREAVNIAVKKRSGENIIAISEEIDRVIEQHRVTWPQGTAITKVIDKAKDIRIMVADLENNILSGLVLVLVVIFFAMGLRNAILVSLAIPFSMLISFTVLYAWESPSTWWSCSASPWVWACWWTMPLSLSKIFTGS
jgi:multidrug efflux pump